MSVKIEIVELDEMQEPREAQTMTDEQKRAKSETPPPPPEYFIERDARHNKYSVKKLQAALKKGHKDVFKKEEKKPQLTHDYSGAFYCVSLKPDRDIYITALEFFGQCLADKDAPQFANFKATVKIEQEIKDDSGSFGWVDCIFSWLFSGSAAYIDWTTTNELMEESYTNRFWAAKGGTFKFELPEWVLIRAGEWTQIKFMLDGGKTKTARMQETAERDVVEFDDGERVTVELLRGSQQLPRIHIDINPKKYQ